jgi:hypothetical protein
MRAVDEQLAEDASKGPERQVEEPGTGRLLARNALEGEVGLLLSKRREEATDQEALTIEARIVVDSRTNSNHDSFMHAPHPKRSAIRRPIL